MSNTYRVGVIGGGRQGTVEARAFVLHPSTKVVAVADTDAENRAMFQDRFGVLGYGTYNEMLKQEQPDILLAALPVKANADAVVAAARAGVKAVFCEKPLAGSLEDADRMVEECGSRGVLLGAGLMVSNHPDYRKAYQLVAGNEIGQVSRINLYDGNGQGGCHGLNLARKFAGKPDVEWVIGWVESDPFSDYEEDYGEGNTWFGDIGGYIRFANGVECFSSFAHVRWQGIEVVGSDGVLRNSNNTSIGLKLLKTSGDRGPGGAGELVEVDGLFKEYAPEVRYDEEGWRNPGETMMAIVQNLVDSLDTGSPLEITTGDDLRHALEMAIALRESHRKGHVPVSLPLDDRTLRLYPERGRWHYKKDVHGVEWYREQMADHIRA